MSKTVTAQEAASQFSSLLDTVANGSKRGEDVIIERNGEPRAVLMSYDAYQQVQDVRERKRRDAILADLEALEDQISARNQDLTEEESIAIGIEVSKEVHRRLMERYQASANGHDQQPE